MGVSGLSSSLSSVVVLVCHGQSQKGTSFFFSLGGGGIRRLSASQQSAVDYQLRSLEFSWARMNYVGAAASQASMPFFFCSHF